MVSGIIIVIDNNNMQNIFQRELSSNNQLEQLQQR